MIFVDDMFKYPMGKFGRMRMSHMIADDEDELHAFAERLLLRRSWYQGDHYDVSLSVRRHAVELGAIEITWKQCGLMCSVRKRMGYLPRPEDAEEDFKRMLRMKRG